MTQCLITLNTLVYDSYQADTHNRAIRKLAFDTLLPYNPQTLFKFFQLSQKHPWEQKVPAQNHMLHLVVMLLYSPSVWNSFLVFFFSFMTLILWKITVLLCRMFLSWVCLIFCHDWIDSGYAFLSGITTEVMF